MSYMQTQLILTILLIVPDQTSVMSHLFEVYSPLIGCCSGWARSRAKRWKSWLIRKERLLRVYVVAQVIDRMSYTAHGVRDMGQRPSLPQTPAARLSLHKFWLISKARLHEFWMAAIWLHEFWLGVIWRGCLPCDGLCPCGSEWGREWTLAMLPLPKHPLTRLRHGAHYAGSGFIPLGPDGRFVFVFTPISTLKHFQRWVQDGFSESCWPLNIFSIFKGQQLCWK